jgi:hypothetical protein
VIAKEKIGGAKKYAKAAALVNDAKTDGQKPNRIATKKTPSR